MQQTHKHPSFWDMVPKLLLAATIGMTTMIIAHEVRLATIEASRYTTQDALMRERTVNLKFEQMQEHLHTIKTDIAVVRQILEEDE